MSQTDAANSEEKPKKSRWRTLRVFVLNTGGAVGRRIKQWSGKQFVYVAAALWVMGTSVRFSVRDSFTLTSPIFYATPVPCLLAAGIFVAYRWQTRRFLRATLFTILVVQAALWLHSTFSFLEEPDLEVTNTKRILLWNTYHGELGYQRVARDIASSNCDFAAIIETGETGQDIDHWKRLLPEYEAITVGATMALFVKSKGERVQAELIHQDSISGVCRYRVLEIHDSGQLWRLLMIDIQSNPLMFRRPAFKRLAELAEQYSDAPLIIAGDFNTPVDSVHADLLREQMTNAWESVGNGYRETWPTFLPIFVLDQLWGNDKIDWQRCWCNAKWSSDHRQVIAEFSIIDREGK
ncbi:MAG: hypothetical protein CMJ78_20205 [Planctomycetaceae bacterium]|nr:hypothetical protein [Planctomycetaceae bacterium]